MTTQTITATDWPMLMNVLFHDSKAEDLDRFRSSYVYRGLQDSNYNLSTALNRLGESHLEKHLLRNFKKYAQMTGENKSIWNWLALAQHHGLPTRLLDWTYSPLIALHFTCSNFMSFEKDGAIFAVNYVDTKPYLPKKLADIIEEEGSHVFTADMLDRGAKSLLELQQLKPAPFPVFFEPPSISERFVNQYALFSMLSNPNIILSDWLPQANVRSFKIIIPAHLKWEIRDKLDQSNINERVLFPGLDGLARWLKRHYWDKSR